MSRNKQFAGMFKTSAAGGAVIALLLAGTIASAVPRSEKTVQDRNTGKQMTTTQSKFYCNIKALTPAERAHHGRLSPAELGRLNRAG